MSQDNRQAAGETAALARMSAKAWLFLVIAGAVVAILLLRFDFWPNSVKGEARIAQKAQPRIESPPPVPEMELEAVTPDDARALNLAQPFVTRDPSPAKPFKWQGSQEALARATDCLAAAAWYEAGDDAPGERSVIQVVLNRARHPSFPTSICGVVFQGSERQTGCQFTFTCDGALARRPSSAAWDRARKLAQEAIGGAVDPSVGSATHYHTDWVVPYWRSSLDKIAQVRTHLFYRWKGYWGMPAAFTRTRLDDEPRILKLEGLSDAHASVVNGELVTTPDNVAAANLPLPPPVILEGVREKSLRQAVVRARQDASDAFFIQIDPTRFPGNFATAALAICKGRSPCRVLAWKDPASMGLSLPLPDEAKRSLSFFFSQGNAAGDLALWNCADFPRPNRSQCLPTALSEIDAIVAKPVS